MKREFRIAVTVTTPEGDSLLEVAIEAADVDEAKACALEHVRRIGYDKARLGLPSVKRRKG